MASADQKRNEFLRTEGRQPETPVVGYRFGESLCLTPDCGAPVQYEISTTAPWHLNNDHVVCGSCAATYCVTVDRLDAAEPKIALRNATDRQS